MNIENKIALITQCLNEYDLVFIQENWKHDGIFSKNMSDFENFADIFADVSTLYANF